MSGGFDDAVLDDAQAMTQADPGAMLEAIASAGAQVRVALRQRSEAPGAFDAVAAEGRPRAIVVCGMGGSAVAGDVLAAATIARSPVPVLTYRGYSLPAWIGPLDLVVAVSCSGQTEETLASFDEAARRGCRLIAIGSARSALAKRAEQAGAPFIPVDAAGRSPRASLWALAAPVLMVADALGIGTFDAALLESVADALDAEAALSGPATPFDQNPAKSLAYAMAGNLPMAWGTSPLTGVAAYRFSTQAAENADLPVLHGELPGPNHNQVVMIDGPLGVGRTDDAIEDLFQDRVDAPAVSLSLLLVLLRDVDAHPQVKRRSQVCVDLANARSIPVIELETGEDDPLLRFARLVARIDFATAYLAIGVGIDPSAIGPITELKERIAP
jgi:glucose/mannose-6-phosphate isomerase